MSSQMEGGSRSDEDEEAARGEADANAKAQMASQHFNTIDQQEPDRVFQHSGSKVFSAKQSAAKNQIGGLNAQNSRDSELEPHQQNSSLLQPPMLPQNAKRSVKQKQIKINPIKLNIVGRAGGTQAGNQESSGKVPVKLINKAAVQKAATISNNASGNLQQQLSAKQNPIKLLRMQQRT